MLLLLVLFVLATILGLVITPVQTTGNTMVMAPAGYRFGDYWRLGLPIALAWLAIALLVIPPAWTFTP